MGTTDATADLLAVGALLDEYALAIDTRDWDRLGRVFSADAVLDYSSAGGPRGDLAEVTDWLRSSLEHIPRTQHLILNRHVDLDGDGATVRSELLNPLLMPDGEGGVALWLVGGHYEDTATRTGDGWRITERLHHLVWSAGPVPAQLVEPPG